MMKMYPFFQLLVFTLLLVACDPPVEGDPPIGDGPSPCDGPNLELTFDSESITYVEMSSDGETTEIRTGLSLTVTNVGTADFRSGPEQQFVLLHRNGELYYTVPFEEVLAGGRFSWAFFSRAATGRDTAHYRGIIAYDPDIFIDNNPDNDDCNLENIRAEIMLVE
jgi:hypothetical protein